MLKSRFKFICFLLVFSCTSNIFAVSVNFGSRNSAIKVGETNYSIGELSVRGGTLDLYDGTLSIDQKIETPDLPVRGDTATREIVFFQSYLEIDGPHAYVYNTFLEDAGYSPATQTIVLDNGVMRSEAGKFLLKLEIEDTTGLIAGQPTFLQDIDLRIGVTLDMQSALNKNITLNGNEIFLRDNLELADDVQFKGGGRVRLNKRRISLGGKNMTWTDDVQWENAGDIVLNNNMTLNCTWTFYGNGVLRGNGYILTLGDNGKIIVERDHSSVLFHDITIKDINRNNIRCYDHTGTVSFGDVNWVQDANYSFSEGRFVVLGHCRMIGDYTFAYETDLVSTIYDDGRLIWDTGFTFSYAPQGTTNRMLLQMNSKKAEIMMNGATLRSTFTGLRLDLGTLIFDHKNYLYNQDRAAVYATSVSQAINFGADLFIEIMPAASFEIETGILDISN